VVLRGIECDNPRFKSHPEVVMRALLQSCSALVLPLAVTSSMACAQPPAPATTPPAKTPASSTAAPTLDTPVTDIHGKAVSLASYRGKALLVVNVASECGYTPQYAALQQLYASYQARGLVVLGFPSNDFGGQEPGDRAAIEKFASETYGVTFPLFDKVHATGAEIAPLYKTLTTEIDPKLRGPIGWNFTKFVVDPQGHVVARFPSEVDPMSPAVKAAIEAVLPLTAKAP
jgi:glutathione peroxidase